MSESELKEADLDLLDSSMLQVDSSSSLKVPFEFSEVNLENSSKRENSSFKHSSGSLGNSEPLQLDSHSFIQIPQPPLHIHQFKLFKRLIEEESTSSVSSSEKGLKIERSKF